MTIRVLHFTESYGAGVATAIEQYMDLPGVEHSLLARVRPEADPLKTMPTANRTFVPSGTALIAEWLRLRKQHFDVVHAHSSKAGLLARVMKHPTAAVVYSPHALALARPGSVGKAALLAERALADRADVFAAVSDTEAEQITRRLRPKGIVVQVPHAVAPSDLMPVEQRSSTLVAVGRLGFQKNPESVASLPEKLPSVFEKPVRCVWVGDGDLDRRGLLESHGWEVTGWLARTEVRRQLESARALIHPARYEGLPYVVLEAMAVGTPVLAADIPALRAMKPALLYASPESLLTQLTPLLGDDFYWREVATETHEYVAQAFSLERQQCALADLYGELARTPSS